MQVHRRHFLDDLIKAVRLFQLLDFFLKLELLQNLPGTCREARDKLQEVRGQLVGIAQQVLEGELAGVVEGEVELLIDDLLNGLRVVFGDLLAVLHLGLRFQRLVHSDNLVLRLLQHAIQPPQHGEWDHHPAVLRRPGEARGAGLRCSR